MKALFNKLVKDLIKSPQGKFSRKSINWLIGTILLITEIVVHLITSQPIQDSILFVTVGYTGYMGYLSMIDKTEKPDTKINDINEIV